MNTNDQLKQMLAFGVVAALCTLLSSQSLLAQDAGDWGNLKGRIVVEGDLPAVKPKNVGDNPPPICVQDGKAPLENNLQIDKSSRGLKDAYIMMYLKSSDTKPKIHPSYEKALAEPVVIDNKNCTFVPHAAFARTGQTLRLKNSDDIGHNCHITMFKSEVNPNLPVGEHVDVKFDKTEKVPGQVKCDMHSWMKAVLLVRDEPYVAITDKDGSFEIKNIPAGEWKFQFWHSKAGYMRDLQIPEKEVGRRGEVALAFEDGKTIDLGELKFDVSKFKK